MKIFIESIDRGIWNAIVNGPYIPVTIMYGRRSKQGLIIRSMTKHIEAQEESKAPTDIKMLTTLSFSGKL